MLGAIIGDIIGSVREGRKSLFNDDDLIYATTKNGKTTTLESPEAIIHTGLTFTDDTVLLLATEKALRTHEYRTGVSQDLFAQAYLNFFDIHKEPSDLYKGPGIGYGMMFISWCNKHLLDGVKIPPAYKSYGNGSAMRIAPISYHAKNVVDLLNMARDSASCTHNHTEGVRGAQAIAMATWLAEKGATPTDIVEIISTQFGYVIDFDEEQLIENYIFAPTCTGSVPQAIWAATQGPDFEGVMKTCLRIGGDTDTIACMAGGIAEHLWGVPKKYSVIALSILKEDGPFLYDEYCNALEANPRYTNYITTPEITKSSEGGMFATLKSWLKITPKETET